MTQQTVLVTGATGFIASHCILKLAEAGYKIRGTTRDLSRVASIEKSLTAASDEYAGGAIINIDWFLTNLKEDKGWDEAMSGCDYVLHVASPLSLEKPKHEDDLIIPAREGTLRVLNAASKHNIKRVVVTSSVAAIIHGHGNRDGPFTEKDWSNPNAKSCSAYSRSKTYAERAAWAFMQEDTSGMELSCVNPSVVLGPILEKDYGISVSIVKKLLNGSFPVLPKISLNLVDVRDVAALHLLAMTHANAAGERFICNEKDLWLEDIATVLRQHLPAYTKRLPKRILPNWLVKCVSPFDSRMHNIKYQLSKQNKIDSSKAKNILGWQSRPYKEAINASADSLLKFKIIKPL